MRDRDYEKEKPAGVIRFVILGTSYVVGLGVEEENTFENLVEARMNREDPLRTNGTYEILNLGVAGYRTAQRLMAMEEKAFPFDPDVVLFTVHENDMENLKDLSDAILSGIDVPYEPLLAFAREAGVDGATPEAVAERRLKTVGEGIVG